MASQLGWLFQSHGWFPLCHPLVLWLNLTLKMQTAQGGTALPEQVTRIEDR
jgi:hypothetical protein